VFTNPAGTATSTAATLHVSNIVVTLTSSVNPTKYGQSVTFTAQASEVGTAAKLLTGTTSFYDGATLLSTKTVASGKAVLATVALHAGPHDLTAVYNRPLPFASVTSNLLTQNVDQATTTVTVSSNAPAAVFAQSVVLKAAVKPVAPAAGLVKTGTVDFFDGGVLIGTAIVKSGVASLPATKTLTLGDHFITVTYSGSADDIGSTTVSPFTQNVAQASTAITMVGTTASLATGQSFVISARVTAVAPSTGPVTVGSVDFFDGPTFIGSVAVKNGVASLPATRALALGDHVFTATFNGTLTRAGAVAASLTKTVIPASTTVTLASSYITTTAGHAGNLTAYLRTVAPGSGVPTGTVTFLENNVAIAAPVTLSSLGRATLPLSTLSVGVHLITARYDGSPTSNGSTSAVLTQTIN
jgi:hypothetical protein